MQNWFKESNGKAKRTTEYKIVHGQKHTGENISGQSVTVLKQTVSVTTCMGNQSYWQTKQINTERICGKAGIIYSARNISAGIMYSYHPKMYP